MCTKGEIMAKNILDPAQILELTNIINGIPDFVKRMGKDGQRVEAFFMDAKDLLGKVQTDEEKTLIYGALLMVTLVAKDCTRKFSFDPFKRLRLKCDDIARLLDFPRYKKLRNL